MPPELKARREGKGVVRWGGRRATALAAAKFTTETPSVVGRGEAMAAGGGGTLVPPASGPADPWTSGSGTQRL